MRGRGRFRGREEDGVMVEKGRGRVEGRIKEWKAWYRVDTCGRTRVNGEFVEADFI